jgi:hypothetical protein
LQVEQLPVISCSKTMRTNYLERFRRQKSWNTNIPDEKYHLAELRATSKIFELARLNDKCDHSHWNFIIAYFVDLFSQIAEEERKRIISVNYYEVKRLEKERQKKVKLIAQYMRQNWTKLKETWSDKDERTKRLG